MLAEFDQPDGTMFPGFTGHGADASITSLIALSALAVTQLGSADEVPVAGIFLPYMV